MFKLMLAATLLAGPALAADPQMPMGGPAAGERPSTAAYRQASQSMSAGMDQPYTGDADHDFVTGMLPHHQGAIDMARVELHYGRDPALRKLAHAIIDSQAREQVFMRGWLAKHPMPAAAAP